MADLKRMADNTIAVIVARYIMPGAMILISGFVAFTLNRAVATVDAQSVKIDSLDREVGRHTSSLEGYKLVLDNFQRNIESVTRLRDTQIKTITDRIDDHETRVRVIERTRP